MMRGQGGIWKKGSRPWTGFFASAYCNHCRSSSASSKDGFLSRGILLTITKFILDVPANFEEDVTQGPLNQGAWVLQERVLSRRTIHFCFNRNVTGNRDIRKGL